MRPELRPYQSEAKRQARQALKSNKRIILCLPTGGGKSVIFTDIISDVIDSEGNCLILLHREELVNQACKHFTRSGIPYARIGEDSFTFGRKGVVYISMAKTFCNKMNFVLFQQLNIKLVIIDEAHRGEFTNCLSIINSYVIGFTATPKASGKTPLNQMYHSIICPITDLELIGDKHLLPAKTYSINYDFSRLEVKMGEFTNASLLKEFQSPKLFDGLIDNFLKYGKDEKTICFNCDIKHNNSVTELFRHHGFEAESVDGKTPKDRRKDIFKAYSRGDFQILCNVDIATTGNDEPSTGCIIENLATTSLVKHRQMLGRGSRPYKDQNEFIIIDMGRNYMRHGLYGEFINWKSIFEDPQKDINKKESRKDLRACLQCDAIIKNLVKECPYCGYVHTKEQKERHIIDNSTLEEIREYKIQHLPINLRGLKPSQMSYRQLCEFAEYMGYDGKWVHVQRTLARK